MKKTIISGAFLVFTFLIMLSQNIIAQENGFELKVQYMESDDLTWGVYLKPVFNFEETVEAIFGTGQITLLVKNGDADKIINKVDQTGTWRDFELQRGPIEATNIDYLSFSLLSSKRPQFKNGQELLLFTFQSETCLDTIGIIDNETDPFANLPNSRSINPGNDFGIIFLTNPTLKADILGNYSTSAYSCHDCDEDGIVDALEDTNGDGVYTPGVDASNLCDNDNNELDTPPPFTIQKPCITVKDVVFTSPSGCGKVDGSITIDAFHESGNGVQYSIDGGRVWHNSPSIENLEAGVTYNLELRDNIGLCFVSYGEIILENANCIQDPCVTTPFTIASYPDQMICTGGETTLDISGGSSYEWSPATGLSATNIANPIASPTSTTTYTVVVTSATGCTATDEIIVNVVSNPTANAGEDQSICANGSVLLEATEGGGNAYNWSPSTGLNNANISNPKANPTATTTYTLLVTDANGCTARDELTINVEAALAITAEAITQDCSDEPTKLQATGGQTYNWSPIAGLDNPAIANPIATPTTATRYTVVVTAENGCTASEEVLVAPQSANLQIDLGIDTLICLDEFVQLNSNATGDYTYNWSPTESLDEPTSASPIATPRETSAYCVTITSTNGCTATDCIVIEVDEQCEGEDLGEGSGAGAGTGNAINPCAIGPAIVGCPDKYMCPDGQTQLIVNGGIRWEWSPSTGLDDPTSAIPIATPTETTTYTVTGWDANDCSATDEVIVTVVISGNCGLTPPTCQDDTLLAEDKLCIDKNATVAEICIPYPLEDFNVTYTIEVVNSVPQVIHGCNFGDVFGYQYNFLPAGGQGGEYRIKGWTVNNTIQTGSISSMQELATFMQNADPAGNWTIDPNLFSILGGATTGTYGDLIVTQPSTAIETVLSINKTQTPNGTLIEVDMTGRDREVLTFTDLVTGCVDQLIIERPTVCEDCAVDCR